MSDTNIPVRYNVSENTAAESTSILQNPNAVNSARVISYSDNDTVRYDFLSSATGGLPKTVHPVCEFADRNLADKIRNIASAAKNSGVQTVAADDGEVIFAQARKQCAAKVPPPTR